MKKIYIVIIAFLSCFFASCSEEQDNLSSLSGKYVLPFKCVLADEEGSKTRVYFQGSQGAGAGFSERLVYWNENDDVKVHSQNFTGTKTYEYKTHITATNSNGDATEVVLYGDDEIDWWESGPKNVKFFYPASKFQVNASDDILAKIDATQSGTVNRVRSSTKKKFCPNGQEGAYDSYNVCDYSNCIIQSSGNITTSNFEPTGKNSLSFYLCVKAIDVILDAPTTGSMKVLSTKVEVGTGNTKETFTPTTALTGTIEPRVSGVSLSSDQKVTSTSDFVKLNFAEPVKITGNDRIVARSFIPRMVGNMEGKYFSGGVARITVELENISGVRKNYVKLVEITTKTPTEVSSEQSITHFYLGPVPTFSTQGVFQNVKLTGTDDNPLRPVFNNELGLTTTHKLSFDLGGKADCVSALTQVKVALINFAPANLTDYAPSGTEAIEGETYDIYTHTLTSAEKSANKVDLQIKPTAVGMGKIVLMGDNFDNYELKAKIGTGVLAVDFLENAIIMDCYPGTDGNPIIGQSAKVTVYIDENTVDNDDFASLTIGGEAASYDGTVPEKEGYQAYTTDNAIAMGSTSEIKNLEVVVTLKDATTRKHATKTAIVKVYGIEEGDAITTTAGYNNTDIYFLKSASNYYLTNNGSNQIGGSATYPGEEGFWKFGNNGGASTTIVSATDTSKGLKFESNENTTFGATPSSWTVANGLAFSHNYTSGWSTRTRYLNLTSAAAYSNSISQSNSSVNWTAIKVTFTPPTVAP